MINRLVLPCLFNGCISSSAKYQSDLLLTRSHVTDTGMGRLITVSICEGKTGHTKKLNALNPYS
jgi:hypothetical protein